MAPLEFLPSRADHQHMPTETSSVTLPRITAAVFRDVLSHPAGVAVQLPTGDVEAAPYGLTAAQADNPSLVVVLTHAEATEILSVAGTHADAARDATALLRIQFEMELSA